MRKDGKASAELASAGSKMIAARETEIHQIDGKRSDARKIGAHHLNFFTYVCGNNSARVGFARCPTHL